MKSEIKKLNWSYELNGDFVKYVDSRLFKYFNFYKL